MGGFVFFALPKILKLQYLQMKKVSLRQTKTQKIMADKKNVIINSVPVDLAENFNKKAEEAGKTRTELFCEMVYNYNVNEDVFTLAEGKEKETKKLGFDDEKPYTGVPVFNE